MLQSSTANAAQSGLRIASLLLGTLGFISLWNGMDAGTATEVPELPQDSSSQTPPLLTTGLISPGISDVVTDIAPPSEGQSLVTAKDRMLLNESLQGWMEVCLRAKVETLRHRPLIESLIVYRARSQRASSAEGARVSMVKSGPGSRIPYLLRQVSWRRIDVAVQFAEATLRKSVETQVRLQIEHWKREAYGYGMGVWRELPRMTLQQGKTRL